jgi:hypothetical protein
VLDIDWLFISHVAAIAHYLDAVYSRREREVFQTMWFDGQSTAGATQGEPCRPSRVESW